MSRQIASLTGARHTPLLVLTAVTTGIALLMPAPVQAQRGMHSLQPNIMTEAQDDRPSPHQTLPLPEIVAAVQAQAPYSNMDYIGVAGFDARSMVYVLRFLDGRQVVAVYVDARNGRVVNRVP